MYIGIIAPTDMGAWMKGKEETYMKERNMEDVAISIYGRDGRVPLASMKVCGLAAPGGSKVTAGRGGGTPMPREAGIVWMAERVIDAWKALRGSPGDPEEKAIFAMVSANRFALPYANPAHGMSTGDFVRSTYGVAVPLMESTKLALASRGYTRILAALNQDGAMEARDWRYGRISFRGADSWYDGTECGAMVEIHVDKPDGIRVRMSGILGIPMLESEWFGGCADEDGSAKEGKEEGWKELEGSLERISTSDSDFFRRLVRGDTLMEGDLADAERILRLAAMHRHKALAAESEWFMPVYSERYVRPLSRAMEKAGGKEGR